ncbi:MAG: hypothetical protein JJU34_18470 [Lunatimonas sp.]|uniref:hypothetical protein n=1 Tax=Lunatimonas sp. TaxID=2060141 RepID=UPI00263A85C4|nr:hypothetical protein [Lunatimonas sp.]MCC5939270.1 hypothetical protein [Lunatimonas sp.]
MLKGIIFILLMTTVSFCSVIKSVTLVNRGMDRRTQIDLGDRKSYLRIIGELLDSKIGYRPSKVIFNVYIVSKDPNIRFKSGDVSVYIYEHDSSAYYKLAIIGNELNEEPMPINKKSKFRISARINQKNISESGANKKIGLKLPPIIVGGEILDFGMIDFELR